MADDYIIELADDTEGHGFKRTFAPEGDDGWLEDALRREPGSGKVRIHSTEDDDDTEGHKATIAVRVMVETDDDTEGHAISIHFPTVKEADAFRRRLLVTGVLAGTVALGAAGGVALSSLQTDSAAGTAAGAAITQPADPRSDIGIMDASGAAAGAAITRPADANRDLGIMDASGAAAAGSTMAQPMGEKADLGIMDASGAAAAGATVAVPVDAASDVGIMDASGTVSDEGAPEPAERVVGPR